MTFNNSFSQFNSDNQWVMVFEQSNNNLDVKKESDKYILEGVFAKFGIENNNHRIYEESDYLPHLEYLNEMIAKNKLLGELDHPERFDISLNNVSHIVEKLVYDKASRELRGRIRILDTPKGKICKTLIDSGIQLAISSRAAGIVESNKKVKLKRIFTFDIVKDPGFAQADLYNVNESVLSVFNGSKGIIDDLQLVNESFGLTETSNIKIYNINNNKEIVSLLEAEKNTEPKMDKQYVTVEELNNYSLVIKTELDKIKESLNSESSNSNKDEIIKELTEKIEVLERYVKYVSENVDRNISYSKYLAENQDKGISYMKYLAENQDKGISYVKYLAENQDKGISYMKYLAENQDKNISYVKYLAENQDKGISYMKYLAENADSLISFSKYLSEEVEVSAGYTEYLKRSIEEKENVNVDTNTTINTSESTTTTNNTPVNENNTTIPTIKRDYSTLSDKIKEISESVKKQKTESLIAEKNYKFITVFSPENQKAFLSLDEAKKQKVSTALNEGIWTNEEEALAIMNTSLNESNGLPKFIVEMPEKYKSTWNSLNEAQKNVIIAQSKLQNLETPYQIKNFWDTRNLKSTVGLVTESKDTIAFEKEAKKLENVNKLGYSSEYIKSIGNQLKKNRF